MVPVVTPRTSEPIESRKGQRGKMERELTDLRNRHREALEQDTYVGLTASERRDYEDRLHRIAELERALSREIVLPTL